jgi:hypothetical protein
MPQKFQVSSITSHLDSRKSEEEESHRNFLSSHIPEVLRNNLASNVLASIMSHTARMAIQSNLYTKMSLKKSIVKE